MRHNYLNLI